MNEDIVKRLRHERGPVFGPLCQEAAAEIGRLRWELDASQAALSENLEVRAVSGRCGLWFCSVLADADEESMLSLKRGSGGGAG
jgi:hypothetical protein